MLILFVFNFLGCFITSYIMFVHVINQMFLIYTACNRLHLLTDIKSLLTYLLTYLLTPSVISNYSCVSPKRSTNHLFNAILHYA